MKKGDAGARVGVVWVWRLVPEDTRENLERKGRKKN